MKYTEAEIENEIRFWDLYFTQILIDKNIPEDNTLPNDEVRELLKHFIAERDYWDVMKRITQLNNELEKL